MKRIFMILTVAFVGGCGPDPNMAMREQVYNAPDVKIQPQQRVEVNRIGVFTDNLAYGNRRGVYVIKDTLTGKEFIGISGVGITETGSHSAGKSSTTDER